MAVTNKPIAVVTGASSGIGAASARALAKHGYTVVGGARRVERVKTVLGTSGLALELDVTERESVDHFVGEVSKRYGHVDVLINNAGGALGLASVADANDDDWTGMWKVNVFGLMLMTRACLPLLRKAEHGHIVNIGSIAGFETCKGERIRVTEIAQGLVETEFSIVRFKGDRDAAKAPYAGLTPLTAEDVAECVVFAVTRPPHVDIDEIVVRPVAQATTFQVSRKT